MKVQGVTNTYTLSVDAQGFAHCSCPAHRYNRTVPCKHMLATLAQLESQAAPTRHLTVVKD